jgi:hypothetical protein
MRPLYIFENSVARDDHPFKSGTLYYQNGHITPDDEVCHHLTFVRNQGFARCVLPKDEHWRPQDL